MLGNQQAHQRRLDHRNQGHVRVGGNGDGTHVVRVEDAGYVDGCRAVRTADDGDRAGFLGIKAQGDGGCESPEDTDLSGGSQKHQFGVGDQVGEVGHRADAQEDQRRVNAQFDTLVQVVHHRAFFLRVHADVFRSGNVAQDHTETDGNQQQGFESPEDGQHDVGKADDDHDEVSVVDVGERGGFQEVLKSVQRFVEDVSAGSGCLGNKRSLGQGRYQSESRQSDQYDQKTSHVLTRFLPGCLPEVRSPAVLLSLLLPRRPLRP